MPDREVVPEGKVAGERATLLGLFVRRVRELLVAVEAAQQTSVQERLAQLWTARLEISPIGLDDDFFELGGDSLTAAELQGDIDKEFGVEVSATTLFLSPTITELTQVIEEAVAAAPSGTIGAHPGGRQ
ncbi:acyl carrier protein [Streptomyces viridifaciens]|nr:acyl carrier protein [Streptomyces viridifaciens]